ncbi:MAG TPA: hypothetical protein VHL59_19100 [Thermoanaerobaculia bacterium]|nr:hypothetical protein [Thermoanaerobaculia bacterium]
MNAAAHCTNLCARCSFTALLVDDEPLARRRMRALLRDYDDVAVAGEAADGEEALRAVAALRPRVDPRAPAPALRRRLHARRRPRGEEGFSATLTIPVRMRRP